MRTHAHPFRRPALCAASLLLSLGPGLVQAQEMLPDAARKEAREWLKEIKSGNLTSGSARLKRAIEALQNASQSERNAMKLYENAMKYQFMNTASSSAMSNRLSNGGGPGGPGGGPGGPGGMGGSGRNSGNSSSPAQAFSEWRKQNLGKNMAAGFKKALQIQCKWMLLCLQAAEAEKNDRELHVSGRIMSILDEVAANAKEAGEQLSQAAGSSSTIRSYLGISDYRSEKLPDNLMDLNSIFDRVLLTPYQENRDIENFRKLWNKRISLELALLASASDASTKEVDDKEKASFLLKRQWEMEKSCFELGDQVTALEKMKSLLVHMQDASQKQRAIKDLEFLLLTSEEQKKVKQKRQEEFQKMQEEMMNRRASRGGMPGGPRF